MMIPVELLGGECEGLRFEVHQAGPGLYVPIALGRDIVTR